MTVPANQNKIIHNGDGSTATFSFDYPLLADDDMTVQIEASDETISTVDSSKYTLSYTVGDSSGGSVTITDAGSIPTSSEKLILLRDVSPLQESDYRNTREIPAETIETDLDRLTMIAQQFDELFDRAVVRSVTSSTQVTFPDPNASKIIAWNSGATALENVTNPAVAAEASATDAESSATDAQTAQTAAEAAQTAAETAQTNAETAETNAETAETNASGYADEAEDWASKTDGIVESTDYSSKAYAIGGTGVTDGDGAAKEWATKAEDSTVDGAEYSAKHYAAKAAESAESFSIQLAYPVGSIYINATNSTNPATLLGFGTWTAFGAGRVMVGLDSGDADFDTAEETGGEKTHTLTEAELPAHTHTMNHAGTSGTGLDNVNWDSGNNGEQHDTGSTGSGNAHNNVQPYITVYMWKRVS